MKRCLAVAAIGCLVLQLACRRGTGPVGGILSPDTMRVVLGEMLKADAYNEMRAIKDTSYRHDTAYAIAYLNIFGSHHISQAQFQDSYNFYMSKPEALKAIIDTMADRANREMIRQMPKPGVHPAYPNNTQHPLWQNRLRQNGGIGHPTNPAHFRPVPGRSPTPTGVVPKVM